MLTSATLPCACHVGAMVVCNLCHSFFIIPSSYKSAISAILLLSAISAIFSSFQPSLLYSAPFCSSQLPLLYSAPLSYLCYSAPLSYICHSASFSYFCHSAPLSYCCYSAHSAYPSSLHHRFLIGFGPRVLSSSLVFDSYPQDVF